MNKAKKFFLLFFILVVSAFGLWASARLSLVSLGSEQRSVLPVDTVIGPTVNSEETVFHSFLTNAITSEFGYQWLETYVNPASKAAIAEVFSSFLSENLPATDFVLSALSQNGDGSVSISVRFSDSKVVDFVVDGSYLVAMSIKKN